MAYVTPKTNWLATDGVTNADLNRIEGNILEHENSKIATVTKGAANGVASLDANTKVPVAQLPDGTTSAKGAVQLSTSTASTSTTLAATPSAVKAAYDLANAATTPAEALLLVEHDSYKTTKSGKDVNGIYTVVEHRRKTDNTLARKSTLSGGTSPNYTTRTVIFYAANGTTVVRTDTFTITYDADGDFVSEV